MLTLKTMFIKTYLFGGKSHLFSDLITHCDDYDNDDDGYDNDDEILKKTKLTHT